MKDELKHCRNCDHDHRWGILSHSVDGVPLYGARPCYCHCDRFAEAISPDEGGSGDLPALTNEQTKRLWEQTSFMNAQAPAATRMVVAKLMALGEGKGEPGFIGRLFGRGDGQTALERQWPEFIGFVISQITDMRGAMVRDESKFAHLVAHTDEIVEAMRGVVQLKERLDTIYESQERILNALGTLFAKVDMMDKQQQEVNPLFDASTVCMICNHLKHEHRDEQPYCRTPGCACEGFSTKVDLVEAAHVFTSKSTPLWNEPIATEVVSDGYRETKKSD